MDVGDLYKMIIQPGNLSPGEFCIILSQPESVRVGAWGYQTEVLVLYQGVEIRVPIYYLQKLV